MTTQPLAVVSDDNYVMLVALVNEGFECMFVFNVHVKSHLRFGSKAVTEETLQVNTNSRGETRTKRRQRRSLQRDADTRNVTYCTENKVGKDVR